MFCVYRLYSRKEFFPVIFSYKKSLPFFIIKCFPTMFYLVSHSLSVYFLFHKSAHVGLHEINIWGKAAYFNICGVRYVLSCDTTYKVKGLGFSFWVLHCADMLERYNEYRSTYCLPLFLWTKKLHMLRILH